MLSKQEEHSMQSSGNKIVHPEQEYLKRLVLEKIENAHVLDSSGTYHVILNIFGDQKWGSFLNDDVTLVSQTSSNHLHDIIDLVDHWSGPISISLFTHSSDFEYALRSMFQLYICLPEVKKRVRFNVIFPINNKPPVQFTYNSDCKGTNDPVNVMNYEIDGLEYPHNLLRNTAIKSSQTKYIFLIDIDMVPSLNLRDQFIRMSSGKKHNINQTVVLVVPSFESKPENEIPQDKEQLLRLWRLEKLRPFYFDVCWKCQRPLLYDKWQFLSKSVNLDVAYFINWQDPWEPFYIAPKDVPLYDERFKQYGFNRISQVCETNIAGYHFGVLNNAFLVHKGYKYTENFHKTKEMENNRNRELYRQFKTELKTKYPDSTRSC